MVLKVPSSLRDSAREAALLRMSRPSRMEPVRRKEAALVNQNRMSVQGQAFFLDAVVDPADE